MAKIISGGLLGSSEKQGGQAINYAPAQKPARPIGPYMQAAPPIPEETSMEYLLRNLSKAPALGYETVRSGLGLGNLLELGARKLGAPDIVKKGLETFLPSTEQAGEEIGFLPLSMREHRPEDWPMEFAMTELPFIAAMGGLKSLPALGRAGLQSLGILGGSEVGRNIGGYIGEQLGDQEIGEVLGTLGGGHLGGLAARRLTPSRVMAKPIYEAEERKFKLGKQNKLQELREEYEPRIQGLKEEGHLTEDRLIQEEKRFEASKKEKIQQLRDEKSNYSNSIDQLKGLATENYMLAESLEGGRQGDASKIKKVNEHVNKSIARGVAKSDQNLILNNITAVESAIENGQLTLTDAKELQKNFNDQIFNFGSSISFKRQMRKIVKSLNEFIRNNSSEEHYKAWEAAENATRKYKKLEESEKDFIQAKNTEISELRQEKFPTEEKIYYKRKQDDIKALRTKAITEYNNKVKEVGGETFDDFSKNKDAQKNAVQKFYGAFKKGVNVHGLAGLGAILGIFKLDPAMATLGSLSGYLVRGLYKETKLAMETFQKHPKIFKDYVRLLAESAEMDIPRVANKLNSLGRQIEDVYNKQPSEKSEERQAKDKGIVRGGLI